MGDEKEGMEKIEGVLEVKGSIQNPWYLSKSNITVILTGISNIIGVIIEHPVPPEYNAFALMLWGIFVRTGIEKLTPWYLSKSNITAFITGTSNIIGIIIGHPISPEFNAFALMLWGVFMRIGIEKSKG